MTASSPRPAAPDTTGELREAIAGIWAEGGDDAADAVLALPALRALIAERDTAVAQVQAVREVCDFVEECGVGIAPTHARVYEDISRRLSRALDGAATGGGQ